MSQGSPTTGLGRRGGEPGSPTLKANGARFLEALNIPYELIEYEVDPEDLSAMTVAKKICMPAEQVFKTLLTTGVPNDRSSSPGWSTGGPGHCVLNRSNPGQCGA